MNTDDLTPLIEQTGSSFSPEFVHGLLTAHCFDSTRSRNWALILLPNTDSISPDQKEAIRLLEAVQSKIQQQLDSDDFSFRLPDSSSDSITEQTLATREWVSGYWLGIKETTLIGSIKDIEVREFFQDIKQISAMPLPKHMPENSDADNFTDLMEIQEYCRIGVISTYWAIKAARTS
ncbi:MAG: hypothetical protein CSA45_01960 [Gammaproteobacteria bacterium]|nr:MAG: hypothetical protein CSA45_01960 [Gammaproteobacteria bacterium]